MKRANRTRDCETEYSYMGIHIPFSLLREIDKRSNNRSEFVTDIIQKYFDDELKMEINNARLKL